jgi:two-component system chemotaxis sensor kinase CheA
MAEIWNDDPELIQDFLTESDENLARLDRDLVALRSRPDDPDLLGSVFRSIHTIKGASGLLAFSKLAALTLPAEVLLGQVRDGKRNLDSEIESLTSETAVAIRKVLASIEENGCEGNQQFEDLIGRLQAASAQA